MSNFYTTLATGGTKITQILQPLLITNNGGTYATGVGLMNSNSSTSYPTRIDFYNKSLTGSYWTIINNNDGATTNINDLRILSNAGGTTVMTMLQNGNVGIGTVTISNPFEIWSSTTNIATFSTSGIVIPVSSNSAIISLTDSTRNPIIAAYNAGLNLVGSSHVYISTGTSGSGTARATFSSSGLTINAGTTNGTDNGLTINAGTSPAKLMIVPANSEGGSPMIRFYPITSNQITEFSHSTTANTNWGNSFNLYTTASTFKIAVAGLIAPVATFSSSSTAIYVIAGGGALQSSSTPVVGITGNGLGVGTASPGVPLDVKGDAMISGILSGCSIAASFGYSGTTSRAFVQMNNNGNTTQTGGIGFYGPTTGGGFNAPIWANIIGTNGGISISGTVGILPTLLDDDRPANLLLRQYGNSGVFTYLYMNNYNTNNNPYFIIDIFNGSIHTNIATFSPSGLVIAGNISSTGSITPNTSDERTKLNIMPYTTSTLDLLNNIVVSNFSYKTKPDEQRIGFIAQNIQTIIPELVMPAMMADNLSVFGLTEDDVKDNPILTIKTIDGMVPYLVKAVQELSTKVASQETTINVLQQQVITLMQQMETLLASKTN